MPIPSVTFSLRCTQPTTLTRPLDAHPAIIGGIRGLVEQMVGRVESGATTQRLSRSAWRTCQVLRPDLAKRIHKLGVEAAKIGLALGPVWSQLSSLPLEDVRDEAIESPSEPLPVGIAPAGIVEAESSRDVFIDVIMALNRLRHDETVHNRLQVSEGRYHPDMEALWSNICLGLMTEGVTSPFGETILDAMEDLELPLAHCSDGMHPLVRLVEVGVSQSFLCRMLVRQGGMLPAIAPGTLRHLLTLLVHKQMWSLLEKVREKAWDGQWTTLSQDLSAATWNSPLLTKALVRLLDLGMTQESLIVRPADADGGGEAHSMMRKILLAGPEFIWAPFEEAADAAGSSLGENAGWIHLWRRFPSAVCKEMVTEWLDPANHVVTFLCYHNRIAPLKWLFQEALQSSLSLDRVRWPDRTSMLTSSVARVLLQHGGLRDDAPGLELAFQLDAVSGQPVEDAQALLCEFKQRNFCITHLDAWERLIQESGAGSIPVEASIRRRLRDAHQVLKESWSVRHVRLNGAVVVAFAVSQILSRARIGAEWPSHFDELISDPAQSLTAEGLELFKKAWRENIRSGRRPWMNAQKLALQYWVAHSPLYPAMTAEFVRIWLDVLCIRDGKIPPYLSLPAGDLMDEDIDWAIEQTRRTLMDETLASIRDGGKGAARLEGPVTA